ncbi:MAG: SGNH/GDSL hydrolase family protein, partial [Clostridia bacterium]|nr:SGNH/GDSL hydrolase family protein [Clostridia bacterium]
GLYTVMAEPNGGYQVSDLEVRQAEDRQWYAYETGTNNKAVTYTGIVPNHLGWWRVENGKVNFKAHGVYSNDYGYWLVTGGKVNFKYDGFLEIDNVVSQKNGSAIYSDELGQTVGKPKGKTAFWYLDDGKVQTSYTGAKPGTIQTRKGWWRVKNGRAVTNYNGVAQNENGWWYFQNGTVDFNYTGVARNDFGWWRIENGEVNFDYNGVASNEFGSWYIVNGKVDFDYNGAFVLEGVMYVVENGQVVETSEIDFKELPTVRPTVTYQSTGAELSWNTVKPSGTQKVDGYEIYMKTAPPAKYSNIATVDSKTTTFRHELGRSYADPSQTTRLYDVRAITKNRFGIVTASSPAREANAANNYLGGAYQLAAPSIVRVEDSGFNYRVTFKNVPYATQYDIYYGDYDAKGKPVNLRLAASVRAEKSGAGSEADAKTGWVKGNQTATVVKQNGAQFLTVQAVATERSFKGYSAATFKSAYDTGFRLGQNQLKGQKILFEGDSLMIGTPYGPSTMDYTISNRVQQQTGANVYNCAVGGAVMVSDYPRVINNSILHNQTMLIADGTHKNFSNAAWSDVHDLTDFDIVVLEGGPNDYSCRVPLGDIDSTDVKQFYGALNRHLSIIKEASQKRLEAGKSRTKVVLVDIFYAPVGDSKNLIGLTYADYKAALKAVADAYAEDPDIDVYWYTGTDSIINSDNYLTATVDNLHMTAYHYGQIGNHMSQFLKSLQPKQHAEVVKPAEPAVATE